MLPSAKMNLKNCGRTPLFEAGGVRGLKCAVASILMPLGFVLSWIFQLCEHYEI